MLSLDETMFEYAEDRTNLPISGTGSRFDPHFQGVCPLWPGKSVFEKRGFQRGLDNESQGIACAVNPSKHETTPRPSH